MSRLLKWRLSLGMLVALGYAACAAEPSAAQVLPPRPIIPLLNNGSLGIYANPKAAIFAQFGQPVFTHIAAAPQDVRLLCNGNPVAIDRIITALSPGQMITVNAPAGMVSVAGPQPAITNIILCAWAAKRRNQLEMGGSTPYWAYNNYPSHNPFTTYNGFFPQQNYSSSGSNGDLYALYSLATAVDFQQTPMNPYFGNFSSTSTSSSSTASAAADANPFAAFDSPKDKKPEEPKDEK